MREISPMNIFLQAPAKFVAMQRNRISGHTQSLARCYAFSWEQWFQASQG
jgi:hypothetical protein